MTADAEPQQHLMRLLPQTPLQSFTLISLVLIVLTVLGTGFALSMFYRHEIIQREAIILRDIVEAIAEQDPLMRHLEDRSVTADRARFERNFFALRRLSGVARLKIYNRNGQVVWSDYEKLIGAKIGDYELEEALHGRPVVVFNPEERTSHAAEGLPPGVLVEYYIPLVVQAPETPRPEIAGVAAIYRSAADLKSTLNRGTLLLWLVTGVGGLTLYLALYGLFRSVYYRQRKAESDFSRLTAEHQRIVQLEKLSAVGKMIVEIAHQINKPLVGVMNLAQLAHRDADDPSRSRELLGEISAAGDHCRKFVQRMLTFTKIAGLEPQVTDLRDVVQDTIELFRQSASADHEVRFEGPAEPATAEVDPVLIRHALFNLLSNAAHFTRGGTAIFVRLARSQETVAGWNLSVADHGPGVPQEFMEKIFMPFFTTRADGYGLGLAIVQQITMAHAGTVAVRNSPEGGASFTIWLPERRP